MGAKSGNKNALKHGFYAHLFDEEEKAGLKNSGTNINDIAGEIHLARVQIRRLASSIKIGDKADDDTIHALNCLALSLTTLATLIRTNLIAAGDLPETETAILEALAHFRTEQNI